MLDWFADHAEEIETTLDHSGAILIRGLPAMRDAGDFDAAISVVAPQQLDYVGGTSPRSVVHRRIMTATDLPPRYSIPLHQEMAYLATPPERIAFFCQHPASYGGQTTVTDMRAVVGAIAADFRAQGEARGIQLRRVIPSRATMHLKPGVQKPWDEVFSTCDRHEVDEIVAKKGWRSSWVDGDTLHMWQDVLPPTRLHPVTNEAAWSNFAHFFSPICMMAWALEDGRVQDYEAIANARLNNPEMLDAMFFGDGSMLPEPDCLDVFRHLRHAEVALDMVPGDLLILDNLHYGHGRRPFSGPRQVLVSMFNSRRSLDSLEPGSGAAMGAVNAS